MAGFRKIVFREYCSFCCILLFIYINFSNMEGDIRSNFVFNNFKNLTKSQNKNLTFTLHLLSILAEIEHVLFLFNFLTVLGSLFDFNIMPTGGYLQQVAYITSRGYIFVLHCAVCYYFQYFNEQIWNISNNEFGIGES